MLTEGFFFSHFRSYKGINELDNSSWDVEKIIGEANCSFPRIYNNNFI